MKHNKIALNTEGLIVVVSIIKNESHFAQFEGDSYAGYNIDFPQQLFHTFCQDKGKGKSGSKVKDGQDYSASR